MKYRPALRIAAAVFEISLVSSALVGCAAVVAVADTTAVVASSAVRVAATVVETAVDVTVKVVKSVAGSGSKDK